MLAVSNYCVSADAFGASKLGKRPNQESNNRFRIAEASSCGNESLLCKNSKGEAIGYFKELILDMDPDAQRCASPRIAFGLVNRLGAKTRHLLVFAHGYNNRIKDVFRGSVRAEDGVRRQDASIPLACQRRRFAHNAVFFPVHGTHTLPLSELATRSRPEFFHRNEWLDPSGSVAFKSRIKG